MDLTVEEMDLVMNHRRSKVPKFPIPDYNQFTTEHKGQVFDKVYSVARRMYEERLEPNYCDDNDNEHYAWELVMETLAGGNKSAFWEHWNSL